MKCPPIGDMQILIYYYLYAFLLKLVPTHIKKGVPKERTPKSWNPVNAHSINMHKPL